MNNWTNYECKLTTKNSLNDFGNSTYFVYEDCIVRKAPINRERRPNKTESFHTHITYLNPNCFHERELLKKKAEVQLLYTTDISIVFLVCSGIENIHITAYKNPEIGWFPFDFVYSNGRVLRRHLGHKILDINPGRHDLPL
ncbi:hypothetical protein [Xenorhabdus bharatensis]|uniref:hypothetical protein n=1 Tax=Xenorhabdus bharatensis TaxID=3136256 RepID=UPI0030F42C4D